MLITPALCSSFLLILMLLVFTGLVLPLDAFLAFDEYFYFLLGVNGSGFC